MIFYLEVCGAVIGTVGAIEAVALLFTDVLSLFLPLPRSGEWKRMRWPW
jgi:hypothetical protein